MLADPGMAKVRGIGPWESPKLRQRTAADRGFLQTGAARFVVPQAPDPDLELEKTKSAVLLPEVAGGFVCLEAFAKTKMVKPTAKPPTSDLIQCRRPDEKLVDQVKRPIWDVHVALQRGLRRAIAPNQPKIALQGSAGGRTWSRRNCIMSRIMPRRRKINTRAGRVAARKRIRELVSEHDDQVVMLIWGGRILGWSLRRIAAVLEGSISPPGRRAGYTVGAWTAATVQRICRRHGIPTDRPADPPRWFLSYARRYPDSNH